MGKMRWRKCAPRRFGASVRPSYELVVDGVCAAIVMPKGNDDSDLWYWHTVDYRPFMNTANAPVKGLDAAKRDATAHVKAESLR
jgi:hypothetical protein